MAKNKDLMEYHKAIGEFMKEKMNSFGWTANTLARQLTIQSYLNLPSGDQGEFSSIKEEEKAVTIDDYIHNKHKQPNSVIIFYDGSERTLEHAVSSNSVNDYLCGRTPVPVLVLISFCQLCKITLDSFMSDVYNKMNLKWEIASMEPTMKDTWKVFSKKAFGERTDNRYVFDSEEQKHLFSSLLFYGEEEVKFHFTYMPRILGLKSLKDNKAVIFQRGVLTFKMNDGMCYVTSKLEVNSQGVPAEYQGFAVIMNPHSTGPSCTCFLREQNNAFGIFILFSFRLTQLEKTPKRKTRMSECMSVRKDDGTTYIYRLFMSENYIDDDMMKYFVGHLKIGTSENTNDNCEAAVQVKEKYITIAKKYFNGKSHDGSEYEKALYADLKEHFGETGGSQYLQVINKLEEWPQGQLEDVRTINPVTMFDVQDKSHLLLLGWLGKYGLSARNDRIETSLDDYLENIHKNLYPELHTSVETERGILRY